MGQAVMKNNDEITYSGAAYDEVPYESYPYKQTHPAHLATIATLFGMKPADFKTARVLELGCASGGNLFPLAVSYPDAKFIGVDLSEKQIEMANMHKDGMSLDNIDFKVMDIAKIDKSLGEFDYVICHGIYSWVPAPVREGIFRVCSELLSDNGVALVSYNTLPGWSAVKGMRDMMLYHTAQFEKPAEKVMQARQLLAFLEESTNENSPYHQIIKNEKELLSKTDDSYLMHDHLEAENEAFYFHDFMAQAGTHGLQYVGDSILSQMYIGNLPQSAQEKLGAIKDIVRQEQYMDFVNNRRFRQTILTKKGTEISRNIDTNDIFKFYVTGNLQPDAAIKNDDAAVNFQNTATKLTISSKDPATKAILATLAEHAGQPVMMKDIIAEATKKYDFVTKEQLEATIRSNMMPLILKGLFEISLKPAMWVTELSDKPEANRLARYQAGLTGATWVTNMRREKVTTDVIGAMVIHHADGSNTADDITGLVAGQIMEKGLNIKQNGKELTDKADIEKALRENVMTTLEKAAQSAVMVK